MFNWFKRSKPVQEAPQQVEYTKLYLCPTYFGDVKLPVIPWFPLVTLSIYDEPDELPLLSHSLRPTYLGDQKFRIMDVPVPMDVDRSGTARTFKLSDSMGLINAGVLTTSAGTHKLEIIVDSLEFDRGKGFTLTSMTFNMARYYNHVVVENQHLVNSFSKQLGSFKLRTA